MKIQDAAFIILGTSIADTQPCNRAYACELLGTLISSTPILCNLLSKEPPTDAVNIGGREVSLPWSFCGAFIIALEDEFEVVRLSVVEAIKQLGLKSDVFSKKAVDFLVDAFQDETTSVRIAAFNALTSIIAEHSIIISLSHIESILSHLDDTEIDSRRAVRALLAQVKFDTEEKLLKMLRCVPLALHKYHREEGEFFHCLFTVGKRNAELVATCCGRLVKADKFFLIHEPKIEDQTYTVRLAVVIGALFVNPVFMDAIPSFVFRHYHYLRAKYPDSVPEFYGQALHGSFYKESMVHIPPINADKLQSELCQSIERVLQCKDCFSNEQIDILLDNIEYNEVEFTDGFQQLLLSLIRHRDISIRELLLKFEKGSEESMSALLATPPRIVIDTLVVPLQAKLNPWPFTADNPYVSTGICPLFKAITGIINHTPSKDIVLDITLGDHDTLQVPMFTNKSTGDISCMVKIPTADLSVSLHRVTFQVLAIDGDVSCSISEPYQVYINRTTKSHS